MSNTDHTLCYDTHCGRTATRRFVTHFADQDGGGIERLSACNAHGREIVAAARRNPDMRYDRMEVI